ncbi:MAG: hypothetical protein JWR19_3898 [Pedosphaera sp.]|nr:hypothetical protein [Pedosphaera sp.]
MSFDEDKRQVDAWLRDKGIPHGIAYLCDDPGLCPDCVPDLLALLRLPFSPNMRAIVAWALFRRKPGMEEKQEAVEILLTIIRQGRGQNDVSLETLVLNELAQNVEADKVHEIGRMLLDEGYGELRGCFTEPLRRIGNGEAINYLCQATKIPVAASLALSALMRLRVEGTLELCEEALKQPGMLYKDAVKETYRKLQRKLAKKRGTVSHVTNEPMPEGLEEWSANLDCPDLAKVLRGIQKCVEGGFGKAEIAEVRAAADELSPEFEESPESQTVRLKFEVKFNGGDRELWLEVFCDDEDAYDLYVFGHPTLIKEVEGVLKKILPG